jgi:Dolichyl-phosphate-mannose-protein mannosyltransferase
MTSPPDRWWIAAAAAACFVLVHVPFMNAPYVNYEWVFAEAAQHLLHGHPATALRAFDLKNANPLLTVAGITAFQGLLGGSPWAARLFSVACSVGTVWIVSALAAALVGRDRRGACAWVIAVNPVFLAFCGMAWSDGCFLFLVSVVLVLQVGATREQPLGRHVWPAALLALAFLAKYNALGAYVGTALALLSFVLAGHLPLRRAVAIAGIYASLGLLIVGPYLWWVHGVLGHLLAPAWTTLQGRPIRYGLASLFILRLTAYLMWLGVCVGPLALLFAGEQAARVRRAPARGLAAVVLLVIANVLLVSWLIGVERELGTIFGEMDLGWMTALLPGTAALAAQVLLLTVGELTAVLFAHWCLVQGGRCLVLLAWFAGLLLLHASVRGSSRYVLVLLPMVSVFLADLTVRLAARRRALVSLAWSGFVAVSLGTGGFNVAYFAAEGRAAAALASFTNGAGVTGMKVDYNNSVLTHNFNLVDERVFAPGGASEGPCEFATFGRTGVIPDAVHVEPVRVLGRVFKRYALTCAGREYPERR